MTDWLAYARADAPHERDPAVEVRELVYDAIGPPLAVLVARNDATGETLVTRYQRTFRRDEDDMAELLELAQLPLGFWPVEEEGEHDADLERRVEEQVQIDRQLVLDRALIASAFPHWAKRGTAHGPPRRSRLASSRLRARTRMRRR